MVGAGRFCCTAVPGARPQTRRGAPLSGRFWICAQCGAETEPGAECVACGEPPRLLGRFTLRERLAGDGRGAVYSGEDEAGALVRVRIASLPDAEAATAWEAAARAWHRQAAAGIATPLAFGAVGGRFARVEAAVEGRPLRLGVGLAAALAALERMLDILSALHGAGVAHGGLRPEAVIRRADGLLLLTDFAPTPAQAPDDLAAVARLARSLTTEVLPPPVVTLLARMEGDMRARPTAADAREVVHQARASRPGTSPGLTLPIAPPPARLRIWLFLLALVAAGGALWWHRSRPPGVWEGSLSGRVVQASGATPVRPGMPCTIDIQAAQQGSDTCRITVTCGSIALFGGTDYGMARCAGTPPRATDEAFSAEDGDPALELAADQGMLRIQDQRHVGWQVEIRLAESERE